MLVAMPMHLLLSAKLADLVDLHIVSVTLLNSACTDRSVMLAALPLSTVSTSCIARRASVMLVSDIGGVVTAESGLTSAATAAGLPAANNAASPPAIGKNSRSGCRQ